MQCKALCVWFVLCSSSALAQEVFTTRSSNLRSGPYIKSKVIRTLSQGASVTVISKYPRLGYMRVHDRSADDAGWVLQRNLSAIGEQDVAAQSMPVPDSKARIGNASIYPDAHTTPGRPDPSVTQANIAKNICNKSWTTEQVRPSTSVTSKIKRETMVSYGFRDAPNHYELDHLLSLQNGGCPDCVENLWPQAYGDKSHPMTQNERHAWNRTHPGSRKMLAGSLEKDVVESHIHDEICFAIPNAKTSGYAKKYPATIAVSLERGQQILATDWFACYQSMMHGNRPCE